MGWSGTLLGPEGTGASLLLSGRRGLSDGGGGSAAADHGEPGWVFSGERGIARSLRTAQWTRASL